MGWVSVRQKKKAMPNPNTVYANLFVDALIRAGLKRVCFVPGSRHTPLILAFARHRGAIQIYSHLDERSAAFFALGLALASDEAAALVCTSGSAAANFFPAIIEAHQARLPLVVLTADRPHELRQSGANQTIDQLKLYGDYVEWFYDAPLPEANPPPAALRNMPTLAARAYAKAMQRRGVVHINLPFRKPLEPSAAGQGAVNPVPAASPRFWRADGRRRESSMDALLASGILEQPGIIYFGHGACRTLPERQALMQWAERLAQVSGYPIFAEFTSNLRSAQTCGAYESFVEADAVDFSQVEVLIRFGAPPLAKNMQQLLEQAAPKLQIFVSRAGEWADDRHSITDVVALSDALSISAAGWHAIEASLAKKCDWREKTRRLEAGAWEVMQHEMESGAYFDGAAVYDAVSLLPAEATLFAGSSLPVRHLDQFGKPSDRAVLAYANRGASGIDGNVSTALGSGAARRDYPLAAILGDITFYHDMNGLLAVKRCGVPVTIVLLNNGGGGIFHRLPIRAHEPHFSDYFVTAHGLDFAHAAKLYGLEYVRITDRHSFRQAFSESLRERRSRIIEVRTDAQADLKRRHAIMQAVRAKLDVLTF